jgi:uncharacterized membrane protein YdjX (TVP38/TMEM64 family)
MWRYLAALMIGRAPRYLAIAWLGDALNLPPWLLLASLTTLLVAVGAKEMASRGMPALRAMARVGRQQA